MKYKVEHRKRNWWVIDTHTGSGVRALPTWDDACRYALRLNCYYDVSIVDQLRSRND